MGVALRPNGYAICALLAGTLLSAGSLGAHREALLELLALWVLADLALGAFLSGLLDAASCLPWTEPDAGQQWPGLFWAAVMGSAAILIASWFGAEIRYLTAAGLVLGAIVVLGGARNRQRDAEPLLAGLQVWIAWLLGLASAAPWQGPMLLLGLAAAIGTWLRLRHKQAPGWGSQWGLRLIWAAWAGLLLVTRQPLLGSLVAVAALGDDLQRLARRTKGLADALASAGWVGAWLIVALAAAHWAKLT